MRLIGRRHGRPALAAAGLATSAVTGLAGHWFAAWVVLLAGSVLFVGWSLREKHRLRRALLDARDELQQIRDLQGTLRAELDGARREARTHRQEARADLELLRAEMTVAAEPNDPDDPHPR